MPCTLRLELSEGGRTQLVAAEERPSTEIEREGGIVGWEKYGRTGSIRDIKKETERRLSE